MTIEEEDLKRILKTVVEEVNAASELSPEIHADHHRYITMELAKRARMAGYAEKFKTSLVGGLAMAFLSFLIWLGTLVIEALSSGTHGVK